MRRTLLLFVALLLSAGHAVSVLHADTDEPVAHTTGGDEAP